jgi:hypothetical protein
MKRYSHSEPLRIMVEDPAGEYIKYESFKGFAMAIHNATINHSGDTLSKLQWMHALCDEVLDHAGI